MVTLKTFFGWFLLNIAGKCPACGHLSLAFNGTWCLRDECSNRDTAASPRKDPTT